MDNLAPRLQDLVGRLMGGGPGTASPSAPLDPPATEAAYRQAVRRWFELTAQGSGGRP